MQIQPYCSIFLFINDSSGGGVGTKLLMQEIQKVQFTIVVTPNSEPKTIFVYLYNMQTSRQKAFLRLKEVVNMDRPTIGIVCGGDGTIMWVVSQMNKHKIDVMKVPLGVIPLGTGNDFSQYLGWGKQKTALVENGFKSLKKLIKKWLVATQQEFDLWHVKAEIYQNGKFQKINKSCESEVMTNREGMKSLIVEYDFCNYFSFGIDGKIGYSFDKRRTKSRALNLMVYGTMGLVKAATKTKTLQQLVQKMQVSEVSMGDDYIQPQPSLSKPKNNVTKLEQQSSVAQVDKKVFENNNHEMGSSKLIFKSRGPQQRQEKQKQPKKGVQKGEGFDLQDEYYNLIFLNINSFMGGVTNIWQNAKDKYSKKEQFGKVATNDGKLQAVSFGSSVGMAMERMMSGFATKITQGGGPYTLSFNRYENVPKHRTYLQIDGQFIRFTHPKSLYISKSQLGRGGQIKVLRRNEKAEQNLQL